MSDVAEGSRLFLEEFFSWLFTEKNDMAVALRFQLPLTQLPPSHADGTKLKTDGRTDVN